MTLDQALSTPEVTIVDVRTPAEYHSGSAPGSINIPLHTLPQRLDELRESPALVLCCASGNRSGHAVNFLRQKGFDNVCNGGSWYNFV